ncbi:hypothetical protein M5K25_011188 [Dendrobium thyrsiflorum]|uniref:Uncharacterized protein n=1 Tax=Dendrobium thyrsiflorum TaxID=117978 RepID=A0ABD0V2L1_DENTH
MEFARRMLPVLLLLMLILPIYDVAGIDHLRVEHKMMKRLTEATCVNRACDNYCKHGLDLHWGNCCQPDACCCY